jgi:hypothetical protein
VGDRVHASTERPVFSFADIDAYRVVKRRLGGSYREFGPEEMRAFAEGLAARNRDWGLALATCAEEVDLSAYEVEKNRCIDDRLLRRLFPDDPALTAFLGPPPQCDLSGRIVPTKSLKDRGQREWCGCIRSKDIGAYSTCPHLCLYCYANSNEGAVRRNYERHRVGGEGLVQTE